MYLAGTADVPLPLPVATGTTVRFFLTRTVHVYVSKNSLRSGGNRRRLNCVIHTIVLASNFSGTNALKRGYNGTVKLSAFRHPRSRSHGCASERSVYRELFFL